MSTASPGTKPSEQTQKTPPCPQYAVILHNDDVSTMPFVVEVLQRVFGYPVEKCVSMMLDAHENGKAAVWSGAFEIAELKADLIVGCGPDPDQADKGAEPLRVTVEPVA